MSIVLIGYLIIAAVVAIVGFAIFAFQFMEEDPLDDSDDAKMALKGLGLIVIAPLWPFLFLMLIRKLYQVAYGTAEA